MFIIKLYIIIEFLHNKIDYYYNSYLLLLI